MFLNNNIDCPSPTAGERRNEWALFNQPITLHRGSRFSLQINTCIMLILENDANFSKPCSM